MRTCLFSARNVPGPRLVGMVALLTWLGACVLLWIASKPVPRTIVKTPRGTSSSLGMSPDGRFLVTSDNQSPETLSLWETSSGNQRGEFIVPPSPDGSKLGGPDILLLGPRISFSSNGSRMAAPIGLKNSRSFTECTAVRVWDTATNRELATIEPGGLVHFFAFSPDGATVVTGDTENHHILSGTTLWNIDTGTDRRLTCTADRPGFYFSRDAASLVETEVIDGPLRVIDLATREKRVTFGKALGHDYSCLDGSIAFSPDGQVLVACSMDDGLVTVWSTSSGQVRAVYEVPGADVVCFSPDNTLLAVRPLCDTSFQRVLSYVIKDQVWLNRLCPPTSHTVLLDAHTGRRKALLPQGQRAFWVIWVDFRPA